MSTSITFETTAGWVLVLVLVGLSTGCGTVMTATRLTPPVRIHEHGLGIHVAEVHVSANVRSEDFSDSSRVLVVLDLIADADTHLDLREAQLSITGITEPDATRRALANGVGQPPQVLTDDEFAPPLDLPRGEHVRAWVAFGKFPPRASRELPERIELALRTGQRLELSRPGSTPVWQGKPQLASVGTALWIQGSADETSFNITLADNRHVAGPLVIGYRYGVGARAPIYRMNRDGDSFVCCNLAFAADVAWPAWQYERLILAPFAGVEAAILPQHADVTRRNWVGPSLGVELSIAMQTPLHGPFPIHYPRPLLGRTYLRVALVHWFGPDRDIPSFGVTLVSGTAYGF